MQIVSNAALLAMLLVGAAIIREKSVAPLSTY